LFIVNFIVYNF